MSDVTLIGVSFFETSGDGEDHHGVAVEGNIHGEGVEVVFCLGKFVEESHDT